MWRDVSSTTPAPPDRLAGEARARAARDHRHAEAARRRRSPPRRRRRRAGRPRRAARARTCSRRSRTGGACRRRRGRRRAARARRAAASSARAPSPAPAVDSSRTCDRQASCPPDPGVYPRAAHHSRAIGHTLHAWASAAGATSCRSPGRRTSPTASCGRSTRRPSTTAGPAFAALGLEVLEGLRAVFRTDGPVVVYPSSGTGAWEAALVNTLSPGDRVLAFETGHFATLWRAMAERLGLEVEWVPGRLAPRRRPRAGRRRSSRARPRDPRGDGGPQRDLDRRHEPRARGPRGDRRGGPRRAAARRHDLLARLDRLPARRVGRRRDRRLLAEGADAAGRARLQRGLARRRWPPRASARLPRSYWDWEPILEANRAGFWPYTSRDEPALRAARGAGHAAGGGAGDGLRAPPPARGGDAARGARRGGSRCCAWTSASTRRR